MNYCDKIMFVLFQFQFILSTRAGRDFTVNHLKFYEKYLINYISHVQYISNANWFINLILSEKYFKSRR